MEENIGYKLITAESLKHVYDSLNEKKLDKGDDGKGMGYLHTVQDYGAKGNGTTDDTAAFQNALAAHRVVVVPGGTYKLSGTLMVEENCCLELSQDTVLQFTQTDAPCITLLRLANLKGNHATIIVPYTFASNVINCDTRECNKALEYDRNLTGDALKNAVAGANKVSVQPFTHWDPQWKMSRYITDINICKPNSDGLHISDDGKCYGTALYMGCYEDTYGPDYMWGVSMSGIRIAGGFTYGIHIYDEGSTWNHDMRVEAIIDGCEIGVLVENCNLAHLAVTIQARSACKYIDGKAVYTPYAKHGIKLVDSKWIDLSSSYVWDWKRDNTLWTGDAPECEYQHIAMYGLCPGVQIYDAAAVDSNHFWDKIYYDNMDTMLSAIVYGSKGRVSIDPKYAFYKDFRGSMGYDFMTKNLTWRDYHNMVRYDVPVQVSRADTNPNHLYRIGYFTIGSPAENDEAGADILGTETITIEENNQFGLIGWSNINYVESSKPLTHYWNPLPSVYENRVPVYFYSKSGGTYTIYRLISDLCDHQHAYNCRVSITNARRFIFDYADMGDIANLDSDTYIRITPAIQTGSPKLAGQYSLVDGKPVVCTNSAAWSARGAINSEATSKQLALQEDIDNLIVKTENVQFVLPAEGEYVQVPKFTNSIGSYSDGYYDNAGTETARSNCLTIHPREFKVGDVIRIRGLVWSDGTGAFGRQNWYYKDTGEFKTNLSIIGRINAEGNSGILYNYPSAGSEFMTYVWDPSTATLTITFDRNSASSFCNSYTYGFSGYYAEGYDANSVIVTINEEIAYDEVWEGEPKRLDESLYAQNLMLTSPNGQVYELTVSDDGTLSAAKLS